MRRTLVIAALLGMNVVAIVAAAQGLPRAGMPGLPDEPVIVRVWPGADRCSVLDRSTTCSRVAGVLQRSAQISRDTVIQVYAEGNDQQTLIRASHVATDLRAAGYHRVTPVDYRRGQ